MKKIMIDMDDVICTGGFLKIINEFLNTNYKEEEIKTYYIQDIIPENKKEEWKEYFESKNVYENVNLLPNVYETLEKLSKKYELYIATAYIFRDNPEKSTKHLKNKFNYLLKTFPFIKPEKYIFINNKELLDCDIKIDDKLSNLKGNAKLKLLFTAYHNKDISDEELLKENVIRVNNWNEILKILEEDK
ncbi:MAG: hypothetical protein GX682_05715 [Clostridiaceae bacterium]|nr:hypothetical protein [Clostridiaceae bacterium]